MEAVEKIARKRAKKGLATTGFDDRPIPYSDLQAIWRAFCDLSSSRRCGFSGEDPIQFSEIKAWLELNEIEPGRWNDYLEPIRALDLAYMKKSRQTSAEMHSKEQAKK